MSAQTLATPVAFLIFNRPDLTSKVFARIAEAKPSRLLIVADGPRPERGGEAERCMAARAVVEKVDWECEVSTNFSTSNMGCRRRISSGLQWVFSEVEEAIILEDDCLPDATFFPFCTQMLDRFRSDHRVMQVGGLNVQFDRQRNQDSYYFSRFNHIWGWATWRRAWERYDVDLALWPDVRDGRWLEDILSDPKLVKEWTAIFQAVADGKIDTWDMQWTFACWVNSGLCVLPNVNLVSNIGFGPDATHTRGATRLANMPTKQMAMPLRHPRFVVRDARADARTVQMMHVPLARRIAMSSLGRAASLLGKLHR